MGIQERRRLEEVLQLARELAGQITSLGTQADEFDAFAMRLAQAHALGLVDQLTEIVKAPRAVGHPAVVPHLAVADRPADEDVLH